MTTTASNFWRSKRVLVTGANGFVGSNLVPLLHATGCSVTPVTRCWYDLLEQDQVRKMLADIKPKVVFHLAGTVGGVLANQHRPAEFCYNNLLMGTMMLHESYAAGVQKYVTLIGACSYPDNAPSPIAESQLWQGPPFAGSAPYALAKRMAVVQAQAYRRQYGFDAIVLVPGNLYGPHDRFDDYSGHVIPVLIRRCREAVKSGAADLTVWGSGHAVRDFVYVGDACEAIMLAAETYSNPEIINVSSGEPTSIRSLAEMVAELTDFPKQRIVWDRSKPDGQLHKVLDITRMRDALGYSCRTSLREGLKKTVAWYDEFGNNYR